MDHKAPTQTLTEDLLEALRPRGVEHLSARLTGGFSVTQLLDRLPEGSRAALLGEEPNPVLARRQAMDQLTFALDDLIRAGKVRRRRARLKNALVDVYRRR
ncbi:MAG: hypothetical protein H6741_23390 [Alphaproteobacteria bacterium]|nr:hypothetical protein [Alphaproteobacteria bacterium]MCB9795653.1 hypothetical protein [Alphaproteobacteria bacterium]